MGVVRLSWVAMIGRGTQMAENHWFNWTYAFGGATEGRRWVITLPAEFAKFPDFGQCWSIFASSSCRAFRSFRLVPKLSLGCNPANGCHAWLTKIHAKRFPSARHSNSNQNKQTAWHLQMHRTACSTFFQARQQTTLLSAHWQTACCERTGNNTQRRFTRKKGGKNRHWSKRQITKIIKNKRWEEVQQRML